MKYDHPDFDLTKRYHHKPRRRSVLSWFSMFWTALTIVMMIGVAVMIADAFIRNS